LAMSKPPKKKPKEPAPSLYLRLDEATYAALMSYINAQKAPPEKTTVGLVALREFLQREVHYPSRG